MSTAEALAESVKAAISGGTATSSTVTTLQSLLSSASGAQGKTAPASQDTRNTARTTARTAKPPTKASKAPAKNTKKETFKVLEDEPRSLAPKARYALATQVVNIALKVLTDATRSPPKKHGRRPSAQIQSTPRRPSMTPASKRALQSRSGNETPRTPSPTKKSEPRRRPSQCSISGTPNGSEYLTPTGECARLGFSFLRSVDFQKLGVGEPPRLQLEIGMLALCGKLIALELHGLAAKELRAVKKRLESVLPNRETTKSAPTKSAQRAESETLPSLLQLNIDFDSCGEASSLVINLQLYALQLIAASQKPQSIEEVLQFLESECVSSPTSLILKQVPEGRDRVKVSKQLTALSRTILQLCPNVASSADEAAKDTARSPSLLTVFKLQTISLQLRREIWKIEGRNVDIEKELTEPFSRCLAALVRRMPARRSDNGVFEVCKQACQTLDIFQPSSLEPSSHRFTISRTLSVLAGRASLHGEAMEFAERAVANCKDLEKSHARFLAAISRRVSATLTEQTTTSIANVLCEDMNTICESLQESLSGSASDYETLFAELADIVIKNRPTTGSDQLQEVQKRLVGRVAGFASSYARLFPSKSTDVAQEVIQVALSQSGSNDALLGWVNKDAAQVFIRSGVLRRITEKLSSLSIALVWTSFSSAMTLARILKLVVLKGAASTSSDPIKFIVDDKTLGDDERGALIEWQLKCALEVAHKSKYQAGLKKLLPEYFRQLAMVYSAEMFPLRRARVATQAYCIREQFPELIAPHHVAAFTSVTMAIDENMLGNDQGLASYTPSIKASLELATAFHNGRPDLDDLTSVLVACETHIKKTEGTISLDQIVDNSSLMRTQLISTYDYLDMFGNDTTRLRAAKLLSSLAQIECNASLGRVEGVVRLSRAYISLGYAERAGDALVEAASVVEGNEPSIGHLDFLLCRAEQQLAMRDLEACQRQLEITNQAREELQTRAPKRLQSSAYRLLLGRVWLLVSKWMFESGSVHDSLSAAKRAVKIMNSIWSGLERSGQTSSDPVGESAREDTSVENVTNKVSKLVLKPSKESPSPKDRQRKGAAFWPVARLLCQSLTHLADVYMHHGVFNEASYSSEQAIKFAESVGSSHLLSRLRYHRSLLLIAAGQLEDAELCFAQDPNEDSTVPPLVRIECFRAKAALSTKIGDLAEARTFYQQAEAVVKELRSDKYLATLGSQLDADTRQPVDALADENWQRRPVHVARNRTTASQPRQKPATSRTAPVSFKKPAKPSGPATAKSTQTSSSVRMFEKLEATIIIDKILVSMRMGQSDQQNMDRVNDLAASLSDSFSQRRVKHESMMQKVFSELQANFSFNVLPESTLSFPALQALDRRLSALGSKGSLISATSTVIPTKPVKRTKGAKPASRPADPLHGMLIDARRCVAPDASNPLALSTADAHVQSSLTANASMILSATSSSHAMEVLHPMQEALSLDLGRLNASKCYNVIAKQDRDSHTSSDPLAWPATTTQAAPPCVTAKTFRDEYIDLLPSSWSAVSMGLNETCDELYITRYRLNQSPLIIRLPFSRQKSDEADEEVFDFHMGKEELKDIIELSNYSCHNSLDTKAKGAKTNWWSEREALDRRLHELLINIENIWLGGFKGIFSPHAPQKSSLDRFRKSFESVMDRHLPSRRSTKKGSKKLVLDDQILELFIGLGSDEDGEVDLDECLADLLYFIVDILQFNGERNAYDEIDFDSMAIDVLDALRTYHESVDEHCEKHPHLILVLDKRLQAFPWESLPCLEKCSVSRVDSMLTLRDRLAQMKRHVSDEESHYLVSRCSGSYILNPSSDLKSTEATLGPALSKLAANNGAEWSSIVGTAPSEDDFRNTLEKSSMLLYFGHGAGSQYIGQRHIRRLDKCSEVVWLMGCSSGAATEYDELEPVAVPLAYLAAGQTSPGGEQDRSKCMAVVSTLWDVTDKDIDRFSLAIGEEWGLWKSEQESTKLPAKTPRKREKLAAPSTPERAAKTPKTPRVKKTPAPARTPARSRSRPRNDGDRKQSLVEAVAKSRDACYLRYLNGAAPVVYGVPVYLGD